MGRVSDVASSAYRSVRDLVMGKAYKYSSVPDDEAREGDDIEDYPETYWPDQKRRLLILTLGAMVFAALLSLVLGFR